MEEKAKRKLIEMCQNAISHPVLGGPNATIQLSILGQSIATKRRLLGRAGPYGINIADSVIGGRLPASLCVFVAQEVIDFLESLDGK